MSFENATFGGFELKKKNETDKVDEVKMAGINQLIDEITKNMNTISGELKKLSPEEYQEALKRLDSLGQVLTEQTKIEPKKVA